MPSLPVIHTEMTGSARAIARISGHDDYPFLTVGHPWIPTAVWSPEEIDALVAAIAPAVVQGLLGRFEDRS